MFIQVRQRNGYWQYDIRFKWPEDGSSFHERRRVPAPVTSESAAKAWASRYAASLLRAGKAAYETAAEPKSDERALRAGAAIAFGIVGMFDAIRRNHVREVGSLDTFWPRVVRDHYNANRKKPSTIDAAEAIYRLHIAPVLGRKRMNEIRTSDIAELKGSLAAKSTKTVNNTLSVLSRALRCAVEWEVLEQMPCKMGLLTAPKTEMSFFEADEYRRLVEGAAKISTGHACLILLAGSAGLRRGEIQALKWSDIDFVRKHITVSRGIWRKHEKTPKGGRSRVVDMTDELAAALKKHRHLKERVLCDEDGSPLTNRQVRNQMIAAFQRAGLGKEERVYTGAIHILRHTFCSRLAMAGVPAVAIQKQAGHADLKTTERYMHLSPKAGKDAIKALEAYDTAAKEAAG